MFISQIWFDIFLQMANHMRDSNSEPNQVWNMIIIPALNLHFNYQSYILINFSHTSLPYLAMKDLKTAW